MKTFRFRALITLQAMAHEAPASHYPGGAHAVMVNASRRDQPGSDRYFPAAICRDDEQPLEPGDHAVVTIALADDEAVSYLSPGQPFTLWTGREVGHGIISRRVFALTGPC